MVSVPCHFGAVAFILGTVAACFWTLTIFQQFIAEPSVVVSLTSSANIASLDVFLPPNRHDDTYQLVNVTINNQIIPLVIDTSSGDCIVASAECNSTDIESGCYSLESGFEARNVAVIDHNKKFDTFIGRGRVIGNVMTNPMTIFDTEVKNFSAALIEEAWVNEFENGSFAGYLALGMQTTSSIMRKFHLLPFLDTLIAQGHLEKPMFSLSAARYGDPSQPFGRLTLGGIPEEHTNSKITYGDVLPFARFTDESTSPERLDHTGFFAWSTELQGIRINGVEIPVTPGRVRRDQKHVSIIDSGASTLRLSPATFQAIIPYLHGRTSVDSDWKGNFVIFECSKPQLLELKFLDSWFPIDPLDLLEANTQVNINGTEM
ncbi:acid protease [Aaosphaeria arxii CBS 175.79]|uniref:Acid protease n=1 Tax=Aaosphaeria arxii CBS 175.79 TaxID=1450172 RepID=A0A6A5Y3D3_9PLEO|nr:acid protease [Aaosphaeria arxii CBS 175.79]KAF2019789.1 acid protease [Aaosphaeria arxii CBS 175.79]